MEQPGLLEASLPIHGVTFKILSNPNKLGFSNSVLEHCLLKDRMEVPALGRQERRGQLVRGRRTLTAKGAAAAAPTEPVLLGLTS